MDVFRIVQVYVWEGMTPKNKKETVEGIIRVFEEMGYQKTQSI